MGIIGTGQLTSEDMDQASTGYIQPVRESMASYYRRMIEFWRRMGRTDLVPQYEAWLAEIEAADKAAA